MADSLIYRANTVQEAIELALNDLGVARSEVNIKVLNEPKKFVFGLVATMAEIQVKVIEKPKSNSIQADTDEKPEETAQAGLIGVINGKLHYTPPQNQGTSPRIVFDNTITVYYDGKKVNNSVILEQGLESLDIQIPDEHLPKVDIDIDVSDDKLEATLRCRRMVGVVRKLKDCKPANTIQLVLEQQSKPAPEVTMEQIIAAVEASGIVHGVDYLAVTDELLKRSDFQTVIAKGQPPIYPKDGVIEYLFSTDGQRNIDLEADRIDHLELNLIPNVEKGQMLAKKIPAITGKDGIDVFGKTINAGKLKDPEIRAGEGVTVSDDQLTAYAEYPGRPVLQNGELRVLKLYEINGDVNLATGNIRFNGEIIVKGNVTEQLKVEAYNGGVQIYGMVTQAHIQAGRDIIISRNAISSRISAGGDGIAYLKLSSFLNELSTQISSLLTAFYTVVEMQPAANHGRLVKNLIEIKYNTLPKKIQEFDQLFADSKHMLENSLLLLINNMKAVFLGRGPLELTDISNIEIIRSDLAHWRNFYKDASEETADITVSYLQNSTLEASGVIRVTGQGAYYSNIIAGKGYHQPRGVFRGGDITIEQGNIQAKEIGGPTGIVTVASIVSDGKMSIGLVHPNVTVSIGNQRYRFEQQTSNVRVIKSNDGLQVFSGSSDLTMR